MVAYMLTSGPYESNFLPDHHCPVACLQRRGTIEEILDLVGAQIGQTHPIAHDAMTVFIREELFFLELNFLDGKTSVFPGLVTPA